MDEITGFWAGAQDYAGQWDLLGAAERAGGWESLERGGAEALVALGVAPARAAAWARTAPRRTVGTVITLASPSYPALLREIDAPPPVLVVEGAVDVLHLPALAVVGTREATRYGLSVASRLGSLLSEAGAAVVSGLARGIDGAAHRGALRTGRTVAVLAHGLGTTAPPSHRGLRRAIVEAGGAVVSVFPDEAPAMPYTFPRRNRWIAGLSQAVVVVEAPLKSGALHTARFAADQGRDVYAVPGPLGASQAAGCLRLLADGAGVVVDLEELVEELLGVRGPDQPSWLQAVLEGHSLDRVSRLTGLTVVELLGRLSEAEARGQVVRVSGQGYAPGWRRP
ncbi:MAG: DNA-processing protein DprA [Deltaproteobacteria bacterium]|nr:DNA-processing protein DprA [Deltaproteobacteria bacterium]